MKTFVIKYGGAAMPDPELTDSFLEDTAFLRHYGIRTVLVHGGGKDITQMADRLGMESKFVAGQRYTDAAMLDVVQMVLAGKMNKGIVARLNVHGAHAVGISGTDGQMLIAERHKEEGIDYGHVGTVGEVRVSLLLNLLSGGFLPVVAPLGVDASGNILNVNADLAATAIAIALRADMLIFVSDVAGVIVNGEALAALDEENATTLISRGIINNGMIPKIRSAFRALRGGVGSVQILDGRVRHSLYSLVVGDGQSGTECILGMGEIGTIPACEAW